MKFEPGSGRLDLDRIYNRQADASRGVEECYGRHMKQLEQVAKVSPQSIEQYFQETERHQAALRAWADGGRKGEAPKRDIDPLNPVNVVLQGYADDVKWYYTGGDHLVYMAGETAAQPKQWVSPETGMAFTGQIAMSGSRHVTDDILSEAGGGSYTRQGDRVTINGDPVAKFDKEGGSLMKPVPVYAAAASQFEPVVRLVRDSAYPGGAKIEKFAGEWTRESDKPVQTEAQWKCDWVPGHYFESSVVLKSDGENLSAGYLEMKEGKPKLTDRMKALFGRLGGNGGREEEPDYPGGPGSSW